MHSCFSNLFQVVEHEELLEGNPYLKQRLILRDPYITTLNVQQAYTLKKMREGHPQPVAANAKSKSGAAELVSLNMTSEYPPGLEDTLILSMKGIAAGMQNTG